MKKKYTDEQLELEVKNNYSLQEVLNKLKLIGGHSRIKEKIIKLNLDTSHWFSKLIGARKKTCSLNDLLVINGTTNSSGLRVRLLNNGLLKYECYECKINEWNKKSLSLQLDHINGTHNDNRLENLRLLCPNCHSQTPTYCGKKTKGQKRKKDDEYIIHKCKSCSLPLSSGSSKNTRGYCKLCRHNKYNGKLNKSQVIEIQNLYASKEKTYEQIISEFNISKNTFYKILKLDSEKVINMQERVRLIDNVLSLHKE